MTATSNINRNSEAYRIDHITARRSAAGSLQHHKEHAMITVTARAKAFSCEGIRTNNFRVDDDGSVEVWDSVAGHYTTCHALGRSAIARIRRLAAAVRK